MKWVLSCLLIAGVAAFGAQTPTTPAQPPKGQMPDLGRHTEQDDKVPLFDFDMYFLGTWTFEWDMPEGPIGPAGRTEGKTIYTGRDGEYEAVTEATGPHGPFTVRERIQYDKAQRTLARDVVDSRGFKYAQTGTIGGDLGGLYTIYYESKPFTINGATVRLRHIMRLTAPLAHRVSIAVAEGEGPYRNYGTPWWRKTSPGR
jgi:hypothetical protein